MRAVLTFLLLAILHPSPLFAADLCGPLGDKGIDTLIWSLGIIDERLPTVPKEEAQALSELEERTKSIGLDGVESADVVQARRAAQERGYYYLRIVRLRLKEAQAGASRILGNSKSDEKTPAQHGTQADPSFDDLPEALKLERASREFGALERMEIALTEFVLKDENLKRPLLSPKSRDDLLGRSSGYVALLGSYVRCKLAGVMRGKESMSVQ